MAWMRGGCAEKKTKYGNSQHTPPDVFNSQTYDWTQSWKWYCCFFSPPLWGQIKQFFMHVFNVGSSHLRQNLLIRELPSVPLMSSSVKHCKLLHNWQVSGRNLSLRRPNSHKHHFVAGASRASSTLTHTVHTYRTCAGVHSMVHPQRCIYCACVQDLPPHFLLHSLSFSETREEPQWNISLLLQHTQQWSESTSSSLSA